MATAEGGTDARGSADRGHRIQPHTADVILEAWGPDFAVCCEEAVAGLLAICVDGAGAVERRRVRHRIEPGLPDAMLLDLLDDIIFVLDTEREVAFAAQVQENIDGSLVVDVLLTGRDEVEIVGSAPKAISRSELTVTQVGTEDGPVGGGGAGESVGGKGNGVGRNLPAAGPVRCSFLVDV